MQRRLREAHEDAEPEESTKLDDTVRAIRGRYNRGRQRTIATPGGDPGIRRPPQTLETYEGEGT